MPATLSDVLGRIRSTIDESSAVFWTNDELTNWVNDGLRDLARKTEDLISFNTSISIVAATYLYPLPADVIRVHRAEFVPTGQTQTYPLEPSTYDELDQVWGVNQQIQSSYPAFFVTRGFPGGTQTGSADGRLMLQLYPVPATGGTLNLFYYRLPYRFLPPVANPGELVKNVEVLEGWDDLIVTFAAYKALIKTRDERWKDLKAEYDQQLDYLVNVSRRYHDGASQLINQNAGGGWLGSDWF